MTTRNPLGAPAAIGLPARPSGIGLKPGHGIYKLSREQEAMLPVWASKWTEIGLSCESLDYAPAIAAVRRAYAVAKLPPPAQFVVCDSPVSGAITASILRDSVGASVRASVRDSVWASVRASVYGSHDSSWLSFYDYFLNGCHLACIEPLRPLIDLAHHCGWWIPYQQLCILQHRHCELHRDADGRLHNPFGMAVKYRDGWGVYAWHGTHIPLEQAWIIEESNRLDSRAIDAEDNAELRRVMLEIFGHDRYLIESGLQPTDSSDYGELFRKSLSDDEDLVMVRVTDATHPDHRYMLRVPPSCRTAHEAVAWSFGMRADEYSPMIQT